MFELKCYAVLVVQNRARLLGNQCSELSPLVTPTGAQFKQRTSEHAPSMNGISSLLVTSGPRTSATSLTRLSALRRISWSEDSKSSRSNCRGDVPSKSSAGFKRMRWSTDRWKESDIIASVSPSSASHKRNSHGQRAGRVHLITPIEAARDPNPTFNYPPYCCTT